MEGMFLMAPMDAWEGKDAMSTDTPNTFTQEEGTTKSDCENHRSISRATTDSVTHP